MKNIVWHEGEVSRKDRCLKFGKNNKVLWFTGLSGSGKSTLARKVEKALYDTRHPCYVLDGDNIRHGLNSDLSFSATDREENIRRISEVARLFYDAGLTVLVCFISPYKKDRDFARSIIGDDFVEIFVKCSLEACEKRDTKGMYKKARDGVISDFTGISAPYEDPDHAQMTINTEDKDINDCVSELMKIFK